MKIIQKQYNLSIGVINDYRNDENAEFALMRLNFLSDGYNTHNIPFTFDLLKQYAPTILGKPIVAKYNRFSQDVEGHEDDEVMVGYVPSNATVEYEKTDNGTFACVDGLISKLYATNVYEMFKKENFRSVSIEVETEWDGGAPDQGNLVSFNIVGVTLLGLDYKPSCLLASSKITRFSLEAVDNYYNQSSLNSYAVERRKRMDKLQGKTYKVNTTELKNTPWGNVDKTKLRNAIMEASNKGELVHKVYALVESGWEEAPSQKLKYPLMELVGDTFYYNRGALSSALGYAKANGESSVVSKVQKIYNKFDLDDDKEKDGKEEMALKDIGLEEEKKDVPKKDEDSTKDTDTKEQDSDKKMESSVSDEKCADDEMAKDDPGFKIGKEDTKLAGDCPEECCDTMSVEELEKKVEEQKHIIMEYEKELEALRAFKCSTQEKEKKLTVDSLMTQLKTDLDEKSFSELTAEGMACAFEELSAWENKAKATAYELSTHKNFTRDNGLWSMGGLISAVMDTPKGLWD